jgi:hypothetical protein
MTIGAQVNNIAGFSVEASAEGETTRSRSFMKGNEGFERGSV